MTIEYSTYLLLIFLVSVVFGALGGLITALIWRNKG